jgi:glycosyltransferase involved in cell wall biosynthesis
MENICMTTSVIIIPCYNEAERLDAPTFQEFVRQNPGISLHFINDGSTDATSTVLAEMARQTSSQIVAIDLPRNLGKAEAVRAGMQQALAAGSPDYVGYWDADLATPLEMIPRFVSEARANPQLRMICGSRICRMGAQIERHWHRHYFGRVFATLAAISLDLPIYDTQCGAKLFDSSLARRIFDRSFISRWLFDVELIARMIETLGRDQITKAILEVPLEKWEDVGDSKVSLSYLPKIPFELWRIRRTYRHALSRRKTQ